MYIVQKKQFVFTLMFVKIWWRAKQFSWFCPCFLSLSSSVSTYVYNMPWGINMCLIDSNWWQFLYCLPWNVWSGNGPRCLCWPFSPNQQEQCWAPCCVACLGCRWGHQLESSHRFQHYRRWVGCLHSGWQRFHLSSLPGRWRRLQHTGSRNWLGPRYLLLKPCPSGISQETLLGWCPGRPLGRPRTACGHVWQGHCSTCVCPCEPTEWGWEEQWEGRKFVMFTNLPTRGTHRWRNGTNNGNAWLQIKVASHPVCSTAVSCLCCEKNRHGVNIRFWQDWYLLFNLILNLFISQGDHRV